MDAILLKPFTRDELRVILTEWLPRQEENETGQNSV